jgi:hypothetical protein
MTQTLSQQYLGRAMNAVQDYLIQKLLIPKIYFDAEWNGLPVHVLAIDRAGSGDVHAVWFMYLTPGIGIGDISGLIASKLQEMDEEIRSLPSHYRYIAVVSDDPNARKLNLLDAIISKALAEDGVGRVGILYVDLSKNDASVTELLKAERFRSSKALVEMADRFVATHTPNWQIPDEDRL